MPTTAKINNYIKHCAVGLIFMRVAAVMGILLAIFAFSTVSFAHAESSAHLYLTTAYSSYNVGETVKVQVHLDADAQAVNAVEGDITFPSDLLEIVDFSRKGSIFGIWPIEPLVHATKNEGTISFGGGLPSPGFFGKNGFVFLIDFKAKAAGTAILKFQNAKALANDGFGTDILKATTGITLPISNAAPRAIPGATSKVLIPQDTTPPEITSVDFIETMPTENPTPTLKIIAHDSESGIEKYGVVIGDGAEIFSKVNTITLPYQSYGTHTLRAEVFDRAGNVAQKTLDFQILPVAPPRLTVYPTTFNPLEESLYIEGVTALTQEKVIIYFMRDGQVAKTVATQSNDDKSFFLKERMLLDGGFYQVHARAITNEGTISPQSNEITIRIIFNALRIGKLVVSYQLLIILLLFLIIFLMLAIIILELHHHRRKKTVVQDFRSRQRDIYNSLETMRSELDEAVKTHRETKAAIDLMQRLRRLEKVLSDFKHVKK